MRSDRKEILEEGGFTLVTKSKRNRRRGSKTSAKKATYAILEDEPLEDCEAARDKIIRQVQKCSTCSKFISSSIIVIILFDLRLKE